MIDNIAVLQDLCKKVGIEYSTTAWSVEQFIDFSRKCYEQGKSDGIDEVKEKLNNAGAEITFNLPVEEILGEDIDLDDFAMLVQDAVQVYRKMVLGVLQELKEQNSNKLDK